MKIQRMVNNREGLLCAQTEDFGILIQHRTEPRIDSRLFAKRLSIKHKHLYELIRKNSKNLREFGILPFQTERLNTIQLGEGEMCSLLTFQTEAVKGKATIDLRTKEIIKNNELIRFVQYKKQPNIARQSLCPLNALIYRDNYPFVQYAKQPDNRSLKYLRSPILGRSKNNRDSDLQYLSSPKLASAKNNQVNNIYSAKLFAQCYSEHQSNFCPMMRLPDNIRLAGLAHKHSAKYFFKRFQPLGEIPRRFNSCLASSLNQLLRVMLSADAALFTCSFSSGFIRIWKAGDCPPVLGVRSFILDIVHTFCLNEFYKVCTLHYVPTLDQTPPYGAVNTTRGLTTMLNKVTVMASYKSTQTHPKFTDTYWIIPLDSSIPYGKVSLTRGERKLFHVLFKDDRLVWSGRKPITPQSIIECSASHAQGVAHA